MSTPAAFARASKANALVTSTRFHWREDFAGTTLNTLNWRIAATGTGHTVAVVGTELQIVTGGDINTETILWGIPSIAVPARISFTMRLSQRVVNQEFFLEVVNDAGTMVAQWLLDGATATSGRLNVINAGVASTATAVTIPTTAANAIAEIEIFPDEVYFHNRAVDSVAIRTQTSVRTRLIPDPNELYFIRIRARNLGTTSTPTTLFIDSITVHDVAQVSAEVTGGRGQMVGSQALAVQSVGGAIGTVATITTLTTLTTLTTMTTGNVQPIVAHFVDSTATLGVSAVFTGTSRDTTTTPRRTRIVARAFADQAGTLFVEQSRDGTVWRNAIGHSAAIAANECRELVVHIVARFWRVRYANGAVAQTAFELLSAELSI